MGQVAGSNKQEMGRSLDNVKEGDEGDWLGTEVVLDALINGDDVNGAMISNLEVADVAHLESELGPAPGAGVASSEKGGGVAESAMRVPQSMEGAGRQIENGAKLWDWGGQTAGFGATIVATGVAIGLFNPAAGLVVAGTGLAIVGAGFWMAIRGSEMVGQTLGDRITIQLAPLLGRRND